MGLFGAGDPPCPAGSICSGQAATDVGADKTKIYHASATSLSATGGASTTHVYIIKDGSWQKAATTTDGGKTYTYDDNVAGAALKQDLSNPQSAIHKNVDANVNKAADKAGVPQQEKDKLVDTNPNKANDDEVSGDTQPAAQVADTFQAPTVGNSDKTRNSFPDCVYPLDLGQTKQDVIKFTMLEYQPKDFNQSGQFGFSERSQDRTSIGTVILPIPGGIQDGNKVNWSGQNMNALEAGLANFALNTINKGPEGASAATDDIVKAIQGNSGELKTAVGAFFAGEATGTGQQLLTRTTGAIINPNLELLFNGPTLRQFSFKFKLTAREANESKEIVKIIRFFKQGSAAQRSSSNLFLKSPHTFQIQYLYRGPEGGENPFMNKIKECALQSVSVNYTPENNYSTFSDGAMTSYELSLGFSELEPIFNDNYAQDNDATIGY